MASTNDTETFQHYQVARRPDGTLWELGRGAMGITYKAFDTNLRTDVALKVVNALLLDSETARARFQREARAAAGLRHRNVATVYHLGNDDQSFFYAMEFIDGETVESMVKREGTLQPVEALQIIVQVARALGAAAKQNLVHRDIKPANLMVMREDEDEDQLIVKVIDFGLARPALGGEGSAHITMGGFVGTPQYASPEQLEEKDLDTRSDIYSLGITLWYMLAGKPPFTGPLGSVFIQQLTKEPPWDQLAGLAVPVRDLLAHMLQKDPDKRPQSPVELRREVEAAIKALSKRDKKQSGLISLPPTETPSATDTKADTRQSGDTADLPAAIAAEDSSAESASASSSSSSAELETPAGVDLEIASSSARTAALTLGSLLDGRYELLHLAGEGTNGRVFQARDTARDGALVALKILHVDVLDAPGERRRLEEEIAKLRGAPHSNLLEVYGLEEAGATPYLVMEWVNGFTLVDLLRSRGRLPLREVAQLLAQAAAATDFARAHNLRRVELALHQVLAHFPNLTAGADAESGTKTALGRPLDQWPDFVLKLDALGIAREAGDSLTWGGDLTMMPASAQPLGRDTQTSIRGFVEGSDLFALGLLVYELLNGAPPALNQRGDAGREARYVALPALNEEANAVLRRALSPNPGFASNTEFFEALMAASGLAPLPLVAPPAAAPTMPEPPERQSTGATTAAARTVFDSPVAPSETLVFDEPLESAKDEADAAATLIFEERATAATSPAPVEEEREPVSDVAPVLRDSPLAPDTAPALPMEAEHPTLPPPEIMEQDSAQTLLLDPVAPSAFRPTTDEEATKEPTAREIAPLEVEAPTIVEAKAEAPALPGAESSAPMQEPTAVSPLNDDRRAETVPLAIAPSVAETPAVESRAAEKTAPPSADVDLSPAETLIAESLPAMTQCREKSSAANVPPQPPLEVDAIVPPPAEPEPVVEASASSEAAPSAAPESSFAPAEPAEESALAAEPVAPPRSDRAEVSLDLPPVERSEPPPNVPAEENFAARRDIPLPKREEPPVELKSIAVSKDALVERPARESAPVDKRTASSEQAFGEEDNQDNGRKLLMIGGAAAMMLLVAGGSIVFFSRGPRPQPVEKGNPPPVVNTVKPPAENLNVPPPAENIARNSAPPAAVVASTPAMAEAQTQTQAAVIPPTVEVRSIESPPEASPAAAPPMPSPVAIVAAPTPEPSAASAPVTGKSDDADKDQDDDNGKANSARRTAESRPRRESTPPPRTASRESSRSEPPRPEPTRKPVAAVAKPTPAPKPQAQPDKPKPTPDNTRRMPMRQPGLN